MSEIKVSIVVPCYKVEKYLDRCVESLVNQTLEDIEIVLVDDGSPDRVPDMCDSWAAKDSRITVVHKKNGGLGLACNSGLDLAKGRFVAFCDSDDWVDPEMYQTMYEAAVSRGAQAVFTGLRRVDDAGNTMNLPHPERERMCSGTKDITALMLDIISSDISVPVERNMQMSAKVVLYDRSLIEKKNIRFESERVLISEDLIFNLDFLAHAESAIVLPLYFYNYYSNAASITSTLRTDRFGKYKYLIDTMRERYAAVLPAEDFEKRLYRLFIGYCRKDIFVSLKAGETPESAKKQYVKSICKDPIWRTVRKSYPVRKMPLKHKLPFWATVTGCYPVLRLLSKVS